MPSSPSPRSIEVRPFRRADREQVAALVNAHIGAVLPGVTVSVNAVMSQLEREPGEYVVDPWAVERSTLVAVARERVVAAAHLIRYGADERVSDAYRDVGEIRWLLFWPPAPDAADALMLGCLEAMAAWGVRCVVTDGTLPAPGVYGVPDVWPHVRAAYERAGFAPGDRVEVVLLAQVDALPRCDGVAPLDGGLVVERRLGGHATRFVALAGERVAGFVEVEADLTNGGSLSRLAGWADVWELHVVEDLRRRGIATWLLAHAAQWLALARVQRVLHYVVDSEQEDPGNLAFSLGVGFRELVRTRRGWTRS